MSKRRPISDCCGSPNVLRDAYAEWDEDQQEWVLRATYDNFCCDDCGDECNLEWEQLPDERSEDLYGQPS